MNDKKKQQELIALVGVKEIAKAGICYPDLYSQMYYSISEIEKEEQGILAEITELYGNQGDFIVEKILEGIHHSFIREFMDDDGNLGDAEEEVTVTRKNLYDFSNDLYAKIDAAIHLKSAFDRFNRIRTFEFRAELAKKGVLI